MLGTLKHITLAVPDLKGAIQVYQDVFGAVVTSPQDFPDQGIQRAMVKLPNTLIELVAPLSETSPLASFLKEHPKGGVHHLSYEVLDIEKAKNQLASLGLPLKEGEGPLTLLLDAADCFGVGIELVQGVAPQAGRVEIDRIGPVHTPQRKASDSLQGVGGVDLVVQVDFKSPTPQDNQERE